MAKVCEMKGINKKFRKIPQPVLTRWWFVGIAVRQLLEDWEIWKELMRVTRNDPLSNNKALNDIASSNKSLMEEPMIISDLHLVAAFHNFWMVPHFTFLQRGDDIRKRTGYVVRHILELYF